MRIRASRTVIFMRDDGELFGFNYLTRSTFACDPGLIAFLAIVDQWSSVEDAASRVGTSPCELESDIRALVDGDALVEEGTDLAVREEAFIRAWTWGIPAALYHLSLQDRVALTLDESEDLQRERLASRPQPDLYLSNSPETAIALPPVRKDDQLLALMARRRTVRAALPVRLSFQELADCLFAGMGITGETHNVAGALPLSMTPSGGARNPYEAYVYVRDVEGLAPGFYHYAAIDHSLAKVGEVELPDPAVLVGGQDWASAMPCVIFLCAWLERPMWKYDDANAYRVVLIEAGHIGQNIMLAATRHGLSACPTAALSHSEILRAFRIDGSVTHSPVYALTLGRVLPISVDGRTGP